jgi:hypothetical protein
MAHFTRVRTTGMWTVSVLDPTELEKFDANQFAAINGDAGGTWAPSAVITIGGSGIALTGVASFAANVSFGASSNVGFDPGTGVFNCGKTAEFAQTVEIYGALTTWDDVVLGNSSTDDLTVNATAAFASDTTFNNDVELNGPTVVIDSQLTCTSGSTVTMLGGAAIGASGGAADVLLRGTIYAQGAMSVATNALTISGSGSLVLHAPMTLGTNGTIARRYTTVASSAQTVSLSSYDIVRVTATGEIALADFGADGCVIRILAAFGSGSLSVKTLGGVTLKAMTAHTWCDFCRLSGGFYGWINVGEGTLNDFS